MNIHTMGTPHQTRSGSLRTSIAVGALTFVGALLWMATHSEGTPPVAPTQDRTQWAQTTDAAPAPPAEPVQSMGVRRLIRAIPFQLGESYTHNYRASRPDVLAGWLLVLDVNSALVQPTNQFQPVLYAELGSGPQTLERFNQGHLDGVSVAFLPAATQGESGVESLADVRIWFGAPELPERLSDVMIATEAKRIEALSVFSVTPEAMATTSVAAQALAVADRTALEETAAELVLQYAPGERSFAEGFLIQ